MMTPPGALSDAVRTAAALSEFLSQLPPIAIDDKASPEEAPAVGVAPVVSSKEYCTGSDSKAATAAAGGLTGSSAAPSTSTCADSSSPRRETRIRYSRDELMRWKDAMGADAVLESHKGIPEAMRAAREAPRAKQHQQPNGVVDSNEVQPDANAAVAVSAEFGGGAFVEASEHIPGELQPSSAAVASAVPEASCHDDAQQQRRAYSRLEMLALRRMGNSSDADDAALHHQLSPQVLSSVPQAIAVDPPSSDV